MKLQKSMLTAIVILVVVVCVVGLKALAFYRQSIRLPQTWELSTRAKGNPHADVKVIEFTDFQCPACAGAAEVIEEVLKKYPGKIYFEHKYFPLNIHPFAKKASVYAECAAEQGKFWPFHDVIYRSQSSWVKMTAVDEYFSQLAVSLGVDGVRLSVCVNNPLVMAKVNKDIAEGRGLGVVSTPTFFVNGKIVVGGTSFRKKIESLLGANVK